MLAARKLLSFCLCLRFSLVSMSSVASPVKEWCLHDYTFLHMPAASMLTKKREISLILLNSPSLSWKWIQKLWPMSSLKICADGSANRLYSLQQISNESDIYIPNYIKGDLDSLEPSIGNYYR